MPIDLKETDAAYFGGNNEWLNMNVAMRHTFFFNLFFICNIYLVFFFSPQDKYGIVNVVCLHQTLHIHHFLTLFLSAHLNVKSKTNRKKTHLAHEIGPNRC